MLTEQQEPRRGGSMYNHIRRIKGPTFLDQSRNKAPLIASGTSHKGQITSKGMHATHNEASVQHPLGHEAEAGTDSKIRAGSRRERSGDDSNGLGLAKSDGRISNVTNNGMVGRFQMDRGFNSGLPSFPYSYDRQVVEPVSSDTTRFATQTHTQYGGEKKSKLTTSAPSHSIPAGMTHQRAPLLAAATGYAPSVVSVPDHSTAMPSPAAASAVTDEASTKAVLCRSWTEQQEINRKELEMFWYLEEIADDVSRHSHHDVEYLGVDGYFDSYW
jgi:hypothetical protein